MGKEKKNCKKKNCSKKNKSSIFYIFMKFNISVMDIF